MHVHRSAINAAAERRVLLCTNCANEFWPLGKRKVDCLETGFASRVDETSEAETDADAEALRKTEFVFHRRSANLHSSECFSD